MTLHQLYQLFFNDSKKDTDATVTKICERFDVDTSEENKKIISDQIYQCTVREINRVKLWRKCNYQQRETEYSNIVLNRSDLHQRPRPPKRTITGDFSEIGNKQKKRRLSDLNDELDDFAASNNLTVNQVLGYLHTFLST